MVLVNEFDGLFEADRDEDADRDRTDVNEEVLPGVVGLMRWVNVDHCGVLRSGGDDMSREGGL